MNEHRKEVLQMLASGQITVEEAERLIAALEKGSTPAAGTSDSSSDSSTKPKPKYLRVVVDADGDSEIGHKMDGSKSGPTKVNIRVPMQLLRAGVRLASLIPPQAQVHVNEALKERGVDLSQLKPENLEELVDGLSDMTVDVVDKHAKVAVFCE